MKYYILSDTHFGSNISGESKRKKQFHTFTEKILQEESPTILLILGDFFDFWVEYSHLIRKDCFEPLADLRNLTLKGIKVTYIKGNHDFMSMNWFSEVTGAEVVDEYTFISGIERVWLTHGDSFFESFKKKFGMFLLKNSITQKLYTLFSIRGSLHLAQNVANLSRRKKCKKCDRDFISEAIVEAKKRACSIVLTGHTHKAEIDVREDITYGNAGYWIKEYTYLTLEKGVLQLSRLT